MLIPSCLEPLTEQWVFICAQSISLVAGIFLGVWGTVTEHFRACFIWHLQDRRANSSGQHTWSPASLQPPLCTADSTGPQATQHTGEYNTTQHNTTMPIVPPPALISIWNVVLTQNLGLHAKFQKLMLTLLMPKGELPLLEAPLQCPFGSHSCNSIPGSRSHSWTAARNWFLALVCVAPRDRSILFSKITCSPLKGLLFLTQQRLWLTMLQCERAAGTKCSFTHRRHKQINYATESLKFFSLLFPDPGSSFSHPG